MKVFCCGEYDVYIEKVKVFVVVVRVSSKKIVKCICWENVIISVLEIENVYFVKEDYLDNNLCSEEEDDEVIEFEDRGEVEDEFELL